MSEAALNLEAMSDDEITALRQATSRIRQKKEQERSLAAFIRAGWDILEPGRPLVWNWHLDTLCGYLEAVVRGEEINGRIPRRLIVNIPPGTMKSLVVNVFLPAWIWTTSPSYRFLCGSNEGTLATRDSLKMRQLVSSEWYQDFWGDDVTLSKEQSEKTLFTNTARGHRESQGVTAKITGKRGDMLIWDDPHDAKGTESDVQRQEILDAWDNAWSSRLNDLNTSPVIIIMQRLHANDITAHLLGKDEQDWMHLVIPMHFDPAMTFDPDKDIGRPDLADPRTEEGELMFPDRFNDKAVSELEEDLGPYGTAGQMQQRPAPKGGGELETKWIMRYKNPPRRSNKVILVDPAGERKPGVTGPRDNTAMGVWGLGEDENWYLLEGVRDRLNLVERTELLFEWHRKYKPKLVGYEQYGAQSDIAHIQSEMEHNDYRFKIVELGGKLKKEDRIRRLIPLLHAGRIWLPEHLRKRMIDGTVRDIVEDCIKIEYEMFPNSLFDDFLDMTSRLCDEEIKKVKPPSKTVVPMLRQQPRMGDRGVGY